MPFWTAAWGHCCANFQVVTRNANLLTSPIPFELFSVLCKTSIVVLTHHRMWLVLGRTYIPRPNMSTVCWIFEFHQTSSDSMSRHWRLTIIHNSFVSQSSVRYLNVWLISRESCVNCGGIRQATRVTYACACCCWIWMCCQTTRKLNMCRMSVHRMCGDMYI